MKHHVSFDNNNHTDTDDDDNDDAVVIDDHHHESGFTHSTISMMLQPQLSTKMKDKDQRHMKCGSQGQPYWLQKQKMIRSQIQRRRGPSRDSCCQ